MSSPALAGRTIVEEPPLFVETQRFLPRPLSLAVVVGVGALAAWMLVSGALRGAGWMPLAVLAGVALLFHLLELRVTVRRSGIDIHFRPLQRRRLDPNEIHACEARRYRPILEFGGWGLRRGWKGGFAYNVRGNRGAQLVLGNGERLLLGSQQSEDLAAAIRQVARLPDPRT